MPDLDAPSAQNLMLVAERLGDLCREVVFVGGAVVPLLATDPAGVDFRQTKDVDLVITAVSRAGFYRFGEAIEEKGFRVDTSPGAPLCRWRIGNLPVDVMPQDAAVLGFSNAWYPAALSTSWDLPLARGPVVRIVSAPAFFATKWEAFRDRGGGTDFVGSHDLEDILTVLNSRVEAASETAQTEPELRAYVSAAFASLVEGSEFLNVLPGLVEPGRARIVLDRLRQIAALHP